MEIERNDVLCTIKFNDLEVGDVFNADGDIYIKVSLASKNNSFNLTESILCSFDDEYEVRMLQAKLSVK